MFSQNFSRLNKSRVNVSQCTLVVCVLTLILVCVLLFRETREGFKSMLVKYPNTVDPDVVNYSNTGAPAGHWKSSLNQLNPYELAKKTEERRLDAKSRQNPNAGNWKLSPDDLKALELAKTDGKRLNPGERRRLTRAEREAIEMAVEAELWEEGNYDILKELFFFIIKWTVTLKLIVLRKRNKKKKK